MISLQVLVCLLKISNKKGDFKKEKSESINFIDLKISKNYFKVQLQSGQWTIVRDSNAVYQGIAAVAFTGIRDAEYIRSTHLVDNGWAETFTIRK